MSEVKIDPAWLQRELSRIITSLSEEYPAIAATTIESTVRTAAGELVANARIAHYLPILIRRRAQARLQAIDSGQMTSLPRR